MSSGFVSSGTNQAPIERDDEWRRVQHEIEEERRRKAEMGRQADGRSLFDVLEQNKMAKQEAFEEKIKLKNQFRSLDDDEIDFLDSIMESTRAQEATVKKETAEQLELFRRQREEAEKAFLEDTTADVAPVAEGEDWKIATRKRRREKNKDLLIPGRKRKSVGDDTADIPTREQGANKKAKELVKNKSGENVSAPTAPAKPKQAPVDNSAKNVKAGSPVQSQPKEAAIPPVSSLGLTGYSSDSE
ncbi:N-terminal domain of NEFA-interacting nuclear protein NIP30-domain-containing protein [Aspergillus cavernicola]|uniref:N-terminal domain of NEFA-interacting nuclear protein NIP30-domain-containing protein n=1 Tax=Aspergillus cavernicola TaxID=176166 RepID=A0ABR4IWG6_9EURO